jgi:hypothetical protein
MFSQSLGTRGGDVFHAQGLEHGAARDAQESGPTDVGQGQDGHDHMPQGIDENIETPIEQCIERQQVGITMEGI